MHRVLTSATTALHLSSPPDDESSSSSSSSDFIPSGDSYTGDIDWDGEWKKVVEQRGQKQIKAKRPGQYKSEVEIAATKVTRAAQDQVLKTVKVIKQQSPSYGMDMDWKKDPKVWIGILALISVALAVWTAPSQGGGGGAGGYEYYSNMIPSSDAVSASSGRSFSI